MEKKEKKEIKALEMYAEILADYIGKKDTPRVLGICQQILQDDRDLGLWHKLDTDPQNYIEKLPTTESDKLVWNGYVDHIKKAENINFGMEAPAMGIQKTHRKENLDNEARINQLKDWVMELGKNILNRIKETLKSIYDEGKLLGRATYSQKYSLLITTAFVGSVVALAPEWSFSKALKSSLTGNNKEAFGHLAQGAVNGYQALNQFHHEAKKELSTLLDRTGSKEQPRETGKTSQLKNIIKIEDPQL